MAKSASEAEKPDTVTRILVIDAEALEPALESLESQREPLDSGAAITLSRVAGFTSCLSDWVAEALETRREALD